jgi:subtilisin
MRFGFSITAFVTLFALTATAQNSRYILESKDVGLLSKKIQANGGLVHRKMEAVSGVVANLPEAALKKLRVEIPDLSVTEDIEIHIVAKPGPSVPPTPPPQSIPWGISAIGAIQAHLFTRGLGVTVCVVDTGVDKTHPDLAANIVGGRNFVVMKGYLDSSKYTDDNGHGTHVAGTIAALDNNIGVVGVAPLAKIYAVKVLNSRGSGNLSDVADGVKACVTAGAQVINMSLGANSDPTLNSPFKTAVNNAIAAGVSVVVAAGNEGQDIGNTIPAGYPATIAVAAVDSNMNYPYWSNFGLDYDDFTAPGVSIYSTWKDGGYNTISGTSMASPHVAGVVALKLSAGRSTLEATDLGRSVFVQGAGLIKAPTAP